LSRLQTKAVRCNSVAASCLSFGGNILRLVCRFVNLVQTDSRNRRGYTTIGYNSLSNSGLPSSNPISASVSRTEAVFGKPDKISHATDARSPFPPDARKQA